MGHAASSARWRYACVSHADAGAPADSACGRADTSARLPSCPYQMCIRDSVCPMATIPIPWKPSFMRRMSPGRLQTVTFGATRLSPLDVYKRQAHDDLPAVGRLIAHAGGGAASDQHGRRSVSYTHLGSFLPRLSMLSNPPLSAFRVDKNKTRSDMLSGRVFDLEEQREKACA